MENFQSKQTLPKEHSKHKSELEKNLQEVYGIEQYHQLFQWMERISKAEIKFEEKEREVKDCQEKILILEAKCSQLEEGKTNMTKKLERRTKRIKAKDKQITDLKRIEYSLTKSLRRRDEPFSVTKAKLVQFKNENIFLKRQISKLERENEAMKEKIQHQDTVLELKNQIRNDYEKYKSKILELQDSNTQPEVVILE